MAAQLGEMLDRSPDERARYFAMLARLTPADRARKVTALSRAVRDLARAGIRRSHPDATVAEIEIELVARLYGQAVAGKLAPYLTWIVAEDEYAIVLRVATALEELLLSIAAR